MKPDLDLLTSELEELFEAPPTVTEVDLDEYVSPHPNAVHDLKCGDCGSNMRLVSTPKFKRPFYGCSRFPECKGTMGAHADGTPLGTPTDASGRSARKLAHAAFDLLWKNGGSMTRSGAYLWMQQAMSLTADKAHISMMTAEQCHQLVEKVTSAFPDIKEELNQNYYEPWDEEIDALDFL